MVDKKQTQKLMIRQTKAVDKKTFQPLIALSIVLVDTFDGRILEESSKMFIPVVEYNGDIEFYNDDPLRLPSVIEQTGDPIQDSAAFIAATKVSYKEKVPQKVAFNFEKERESA